MKEQIDKAIRAGYNKYIVRHVYIDPADQRCRTDIMFEEITNNVMEIINQVKSKDEKVV